MQECTLTPLFYQAHAGCPQPLPQPMPTQRDGAAQQGYPCMPALAVTRPNRVKMETPV